MEGLEAEPDPDHQAETEEDRGQEQQEEQQAHVGGRVQLQVDDTELAALPCWAQVLQRTVREVSRGGQEFPLLISNPGAEGEEYSPLVLSIPISDKP